jgi:hypothetical protein
MMIVDGTVLYGLMSEKELNYPVNGIPAGAQARLILRPDYFMRIVIRHNGESTKHFLERDGPKAFKVGSVIGINKTLQ